MRKFREIQDILEEIPNIKKIYLLGSTGAGKTSLVQKILGTSEFSFPTTSHRRTTVAPTEYIVKKDLKFKTTIILKKKEDIENSIYELIEMAIIKSVESSLPIEDIIFELEQTPDERFKLKHIISAEILQITATYISESILPQLNNADEEIITKPEIVKEINKLVDKLLNEIESVFNEKCGNSHKLFSDEPYTIEGINNKKDFILKNKRLLANELGSIAVLVEYARIEGDLLADYLDENLSFILIDGEGIGHTLSENRDTLSTRHHDYFNFCNSIILVENSTEPFTTGGQGAIESIFLNGYQSKFRLVFTKTDKLEVSDKNSYFRRNIRNLSDALKKEHIIFNIENKNIPKLANLNKKAIAQNEENEIEKLLTNINETIDSKTIDLEYDFNNLFSTIDTDGFVNRFKDNIVQEHWAVIKAFSRRMLNEEFQYKYIKPIGWMLHFFMQDINEFLRRDDDLQSEILESKNKIKQEFSKKIIVFLYENFITNKVHLWKQAYEKYGSGSDKERKNFIFDNILKAVIPSRDDDAVFNIFKQKIKQLLLESGAKELQTAIKINIKSIDIEKVYGKNNIKWELEKNVNILLGKNGSGKSTVIKLIDACINNRKEILEQYGFPSIELTLDQVYENGETKEVKIKNSNSLSNITSVLLNTFDSNENRANKNKSYLDSKLLKLIDDFGKYQRSLNKIIAKDTEKNSERSDDILEKILNSKGAVNDELIIEFKETKVRIDSIIQDVNKPINELKNILDYYLNTTRKTVIIDDEKEPLLVKFTDNDKYITTNLLSSGEKQLIIIFLTIILQKDKPFILLMDEPETSLHVEWQSTLIDKMQNLNSDMQIIIATHNPLITLNRKEKEIGIIDANKEVIQTNEKGTKYIDISTILLKYFNLSSLIGIDMQNDIKRTTKLKLKETLSKLEKKELENLIKVLDNNFAGDIIYNRQYFSFLKFLRDNKGIDFDKFEEIDEDELTDFLNSFKEQFND